MKAGYLVPNPNTAGATRDKVCWKCVRIALTCLGTPKVDLQTLKQEATLISHMSEIQMILIKISLVSAQGV